MSSMAISVGFASNVGSVRHNNEDSLLSGTQIFLVADGMGGHAAGDVASAMVVHELKTIDGDEYLTENAVITAIKRAHFSVQSYGISQPNAAGLGTTIAGIAFLGTDRQIAQIFSVGDSRVYRFASDRLVQLTVDHSEVQELIEAGVISQFEAHTHASRSVITRSIGQLNYLDIDSRLIPVRDGDRFLVCSDGLSSEAVDVEIAAVLRTTRDAQAAADQLVELALSHGGRDNISVIVLDTSESDQEPPKLTVHTLTQADLAEESLENTMPNGRNI